MTSGQSLDSGQTSFFSLFYAENKRLESAESKRNEIEAHLYIDQPTLRRALEQLYGTAGHLLKVWFVLKKMGLKVGSPAMLIDTSNSTDSLKRLFDCGADDGRFYVPFAHTPRYLTMKHDASRSIIQTTIQRWASSGSVVTCDPTGYLEISNADSSGLTVKTGRKYPLGLGQGESGFARNDDSRVAVPLAAFAVWYGRWTDIPAGGDAIEHLTNAMLADLSIDAAEAALVFVDKDLTVNTSPQPLSKADVFNTCLDFIEGKEEPVVEMAADDFNTYTKKITGMVTGLTLPQWLRISPEQQVRELLDAGHKSILLYGPPRTGKTRIIDELFPRSSPERETIQIHDGWSYDNLIQGMRPDINGKWDWQNGPLKDAIEKNKKVIVLEEVNRTQLSQSLGEIFSLIEPAYRGEENAIRLRVRTY